MKKRLSLIIDKLNKELQNEFNNDTTCQSVEVSITHNNRYDIIVSLDINNIIKVDVVNSEHERYYTNIESYIAEHISDWNDLESEEYDEWDDHGFASEDDYIRWKYA
jgi:hypothetical protein